MIFKIQRPIAWTTIKPQLLIYNKSKSIFFECNPHKYLKRFIGKDIKIFVHGKMQKDGFLEIEKIANWQKW